jgi:hypothetical protein
MEETTLPPQTQAGAGFEPTRVPQFVVFLENRVGRLQQLVQAFDDPDNHIVAIAVEESADAALVRLICSDADLTRKLLNKNHFAFGESDVLAVELPRNTLNPLVAICTAMLSAEINIHYAYPLLLPLRGPTLALYVDEPTLAAQILLRKGFCLVGESDLKS